MWRILLLFQLDGAAWLAQNRRYAHQRSKREMACSQQLTDLARLFYVVGSPKSRQAAKGQ
jgi:hypothetical protein